MGGFSFRLSLAMAYQDFGKDLAAMREQMIKLGQFQILHNELRKDFGTLYVITAQRLQQGIPAPEMVRACLKELFSLIEADLYLLNGINPYSGYYYKQDFNRMFKKTYKQHCRTHDKMPIYNSFSKTNLATLHILKDKRNELMHPKGAESIKADPELFKLTHEFFKQYVDFVTAIMQDVGVQVSGANLMAFFEALRRK